MDNGIQNITNTYANGQYYLVNDKQTDTSILYNLKDVSTISRIKNSVILIISGEKNITIRENFDTDEDTKNYFNYILVAIIEKAPLISKAIYENSKE